MTNDDNDFLQQVKEELYKETFQVEIDSFSEKKVEHLVELIDDLDAQNNESEEEITAGYLRCRKRVKEELQKYNSNQPRILPVQVGKKCVVAAVLCFAVLFSVNVVSEATMKQSIFNLVLKRNSSTVSEYQTVAESYNKSFDSIAAAEQYLGEKILLPEDMKGLVCESISVNMQSNILHINVLFQSESGNYMSFYISKLESDDFFFNNMKAGGKWVSAQIPGLKLSNVECITDEDNYRIYAVINEKSYEINTDLSVEQIVSVLNSFSFLDEQ